MGRNLSLYNSCKAIESQLCSLSPFGWCGVLEPQANNESNAANSKVGTMGF